MARFRRLLTIAVTAGVLAGIVGCSGDGHGVRVPLGSEGLEECQPRSIAVEDLRDIGEPGCNLVGSSLVFPDGTSLVVSDVGEVFSSSTSVDNEEQHLVVNWGVPGIGAFDGAH